MGWLSDQGRTVTYVTPFLDQGLATGDGVTVMRDGKVVRTSAVAGETKASLVEAMLGEPADVAFPAVPPAPDASVAPLLEVRGMATEAGPSDPFLPVRPGVIASVIGLSRRGRAEVVLGS